MVFQNVVQDIYLYYLLIVFQLMVYVKLDTKYVGTYNNLNVVYHFHNKQNHHILHYIINLHHHIINLHHILHHIQQLKQKAAQTQQVLGAPQQPQGLPAPGASAQVPTGVQNPPGAVHPDNMPMAMPRKAEI